MFGQSPQFEDKALRKRRTLWLSFAAVLIPLVVMMMMQYHWLTELKQKSTIATRASMENHLDYLVEQVLNFHSYNAQQALDLPIELTSNPEKLAKYLTKRASVWDKAAKTKGMMKKRGIEGVSLVFVQRFDAGKREKAFMFDPRSGEIAQKIQPDLFLDIKYQINKWRMMAEAGERPGKTKTYFVVDDVNHPLVLNPIVEEQQMIGLAGMVIDMDFMRDELLPYLVSTIMPKLEGERVDAFTLKIFDWRYEEILVSGCEVHPDADYVARRMNPLLPPWEARLYQNGQTMEQAARASLWFNMTLSVILAIALISGILWTMRTAAREFKLSSMKGDFVSNVSHELRTPLASIRVFGEFLRLGRFHDRDKAREYGEYIETESRRLTQLINNILDFSKIESGQKTYRFEISDLETVVQRMLKTYEVRVQHEGMRLDFQGETLPAVSLDAGAIGQAFGNLLDNAIKYRNGGKDILVRLYREGQQAVLSVQDFGMGIAIEEQARIFDRFHRVGGSLVHDVKGTGLGLSIVQHIVLAHGGTVDVVSQLGKGSTFSIRLPLADGVPEAMSELGEAVECKS